MIDGFEVTEGELLFQSRLSRDFIASIGEICVSIYLYPSLFGQMMEKVKGRGIKERMKGSDCSLVGEIRVSIYPYPSISGQMIEKMKGRGIIGRMKGSDCSFL